MAFEIIIQPSALKDIQESIDYYEDIQFDLGIRFENDLNAIFELLESTPHFQIRYDEVRCIPLNKFPFLIHYTIPAENSIIYVRAVLHTSRKPLF